MMNLKFLLFFLFLSSVFISNSVFANCKNIEVVKTGQGLPGQVEVFIRNKTDMEMMITYKLYIDADHTDKRLKEEDFTKTFSVKGKSIGINKVLIGLNRIVLKVELLKCE